MNTPSIGGKIEEVGDAAKGAGLRGKGAGLRHTYLEGAWSRLQMSWRERLQEERPLQRERRQRTSLDPERKRGITVGDEMRDDTRRKSEGKPE